VSKGTSALASPDCVVTEPACTITTFTLTRISDSDKAYSNGLQQIKFKIELAFTRDGKPGVPSTSELASLTIAFADEPVPRPLPFEETGLSGWFNSPGVDRAEDLKHYKGYLFHPESSPVDGDSSGDSASPSASTNRYFYVANRRGSAQATSLCAHVTFDDGWTFLTNGMMFDNCGGEHVGDQNSRAEVRADVFAGAPIDRYPWVRDTLSGDDIGEDGQGAVIPPSDPDSVHRYSLSFNSPTGEPVGIRYMSVSAPGMIQWQDKVHGEEFACYTGYAQPGSLELIWNTSLPTGPTAKPTLPTSNVQQGVFVLVGRQKVSYESGKENGPLIVSTTDWYGNADALKVKFASTSGSGRWKLVPYK
jgi:hypothetical protein